MAGKSLGTLTLDLVARVGGFVGALSQAERASEEWSAKVKKEAAATGKAIAAVGAAAASAAAGIGAAGVALLHSTAQQIAETDKWARSLKVSTQELLAWQYAAKQAGLEGDNIADIFKDIGDKIGDAVLNKSGEAVDALNALGLSAEKLSKVSPDQQLLAIGTALEKIGTNGEKITILESMGNDLSRMLPLFNNNNEKLRDFILLAKDYGIAPDEKSIENLLKVNQIFEDMKDLITGLKMKIASGLANVDLNPLMDSLHELHDTLTDPKVLQGISDLVAEVAGLAGWLIKAAAAAGSLAKQTNNGIAARGGNVDTSNIDQVNARIEILQSNLSKRSGIYSQDASFFGWLTGKDDSVAALNKELAKLISVRDKLLQQGNENTPESTLPTGAATVGSGFKLGPGETNGTDKAAEAAAKKLESAFKAAEQGYQKQIALIETTGKKTAEVTELQKLQFDLTQGKLAGLNAAQQERLKSLATEADRLNAVKKANEENLKVAEFVANLQKQNANARATMNIEIAGAGLGDKARERLREQLSVEQDFLNQRQQLQMQYQSGDITKSLYDSETKALNDSLSERLGDMANHYNQLDSLQGNWLVGMQEGFNRFRDDMADIGRTVSDGVYDSLHGAFDNITSMLEGNKVSWKDWGISVLKIIEKVALQMAITNAMSAASSSSGSGGWLGIIGSVAASYFGGSAAGAAGASAGQSYSVPSYRPNALGGVYNSASLSAYSNGVYNSPQVFAFAKGAGVFGEAGPEAIMPLTRAADGSLGVRAVSGGSGGGGAPVVNITIDGNGNTNSKSSPGYEQFGRDVGRFVDQRYRENLGRDIAPGGAIWNMAKGR